MSSHLGTVPVPSCTGACCDVQVCALEPWLPALEELHLCSNHMSTFQDADLQQGAFSSLQVGGGHR